LTTRMKVTSRNVESSTSICHEVSRYTSKSQSSSVRLHKYLKEEEEEEEEEAGCRNICIALGSYAPLWQRSKEVKRGERYARRPSLLYRSINRCLNGIQKEKANHKLAETDVDGVWRSEREVVEVCGRDASVGRPRSFKKRGIHTTEGSYIAGFRSLWWLGRHEVGKDLGSRSRRCREHHSCSRLCSHSCFASAAAPAHTSVGSRSSSC
jgi:hypothetical protein